MPRSNLKFKAAKPARATSSVAAPSTPPTPTPAPTAEAIPTVLDVAPISSTEDHTSPALFEIRPDMQFWDDPVSCSFEDIVKHHETWKSTRDMLNKGKILDARLQEVETILWLIELWTLASEGRWSPKNTYTLFNNVLSSHLQGHNSQDGYQLLRQAALTSSGGDGPVIFVLTHIDLRFNENGGDLQKILADVMHYTDYRCFQSNLKYGVTLMTIQLNTIGRRIMRDDPLFREAMFDTIAEMTKPHPYINEPFSQTKRRLIYGNPANWAKTITRKLNWLRIVSQPIKLDSLADNSHIVPGSSQSPLVL